MQYLEDPSWPESKVLTDEWADAQQGLGRLIDAEHGTTIEIALYGFCIPQG